MKQPVCLATFLAFWFISAVVPLDAGEVPGRATRAERRPLNLLRYNCGPFRIRYDHCSMAHCKQPLTRLTSNLTVPGSRDIENLRMTVADPSETVSA